MTSALPHPFDPSFSTFSFMNPSFSYPPPSTIAPTSTLSYALSPSPFSNHPTFQSTDPFFASSSSAPSVGLLAGSWEGTPASTASCAGAPPTFATSLAHSNNTNNEYLYSDAQSLSDIDIKSEIDESSPSLTINNEHHLQQQASSTSISSSSSLPQKSNKRKKPASSKNKKGKEQVVVSGEGSEDEFVGGREGQAGTTRGGKRRGSGGGSSELGSGDGGEGGRGTTLAEVLAEQGLTQEIYNGLPSAKKRQLRNKVSARAFRARRKDYIETLEGQLAEKDGRVESQRAEIAKLKIENQLLRAQLQHSHNDH